MLILAFSLFSSASVLLPCVQEDQPAVFEQELARATRKMEQGKWKSARVQLERALESHAEQPYVLGHLGQIELLLKRCTFWEAQGEIDVASYFKGELVSYSAATGKLKLRYREEGPHDFEQRGFARVHAVTFSGPYSIEIERRTGPSVVVCAEGQNSIQVGFGRVFHLGKKNPNHKKPTQRWCQVNATLVDEHGEKQRDEVRKDFTSKASLKEITYKVSVSADRVKATFNGKKVTSYKKPRDLWGALALPLGGENIGNVVVEGVATEWLERKRDEAFEEEWKGFEKTWKLEEHLPDWMNGALEGAPASAPPASAGLEPSELSQDGIRLWNDAVRAMGAGDFEQVVEKTDELFEIEADVPKAAHLQAQAWFALRSKGRAIDVLEGLFARHPTDLEGVRLLARMYLISGRFQDVLATVQRAVAAGLAPTGLQDLSITANKGLHGPAWSEKHTYESRHYRVSSDLSHSVCRSVALELEETHRHVSRRLGVGQHDETRRFQVFVFAGKASYLDYIEDVFEGRGESTQGMYSSYLKQLLVLDSEPRDTLMHTVRHEGFHQYFDAILDAPPIWLNEGLAEYFAASRTPSGAWKDGRVDARRLGTLRGTAGSPGLALSPLERFFAQDQPSFMADAQRNYAQAWALVHFLRHSTVENEGRFDALMAALLEGQSNELAMRAAFGDADLEVLREALERYVQKL